MTVKITTQQLVNRNSVFTLTNANTNVDVLTTMDAVAVLNFMANNPTVAFTLNTKEIR